MSQQDSAAQKITGTCSACGRSFAVTRLGKLRKHWARDGMGKGLPFSDPCTGSGTAPAEAPVPQFKRNHAAIHDAPAGACRVCDEVRAEHAVTS
jgi:hypothetical protein